MSNVSMKELLEAGVHFGHQTRRWNPKMAPYIFGERNGIHIIDLRQTMHEIDRACDFVRGLAAGGGTVLFVGTKRQVQSAIEQAAGVAGMPYVNFRWLGGMLTNFKTINRRIFYMKELTEMESTGVMDQLPKKERLRLRRELVQLERALGGVAEMTSPPSAMFVVDINAEQIAVKEAVRLNIPVIALTDSNCDPDDIEYVIPGNDDAIRAAALVANTLAAACAEGRRRAESEEAAAAEAEEEVPGPQPALAAAEAPVDEPADPLPEEGTTEEAGEAAVAGAADEAPADPLPEAEVYRVPPDKDTDPVAEEAEARAIGEDNAPPDSGAATGGVETADDTEAPAAESGESGESGRETVPENQS